VKYVGDGRTIVIEVADFEPFEVNGIRFAKETLFDRFRRQVLENLLIVFAQRAEAEWELLNVRFGPIEKATLELAKVMRQPPEVLHAALRKYLNERIDCPRL
jgi:hypothetical protein